MLFQHTLKSWLFHLTCSCLKQGCVCSRQMQIALLYPNAMIPSWLGFCTLCHILEMCLCVFTHANACSDGIVNYTAICNHNPESFWGFLSICLLVLSPSCLVASECGQARPRMHLYQRQLLSCGGEGWGVRKLIGADRGQGQLFRPKTGVNYCLLYLLLTFTNNVFLT